MCDLACPVADGRTDGVLFQLGFQGSSEKTMASDATGRAFQDLHEPAILNHRPSKTETGEILGQSQPDVWADRVWQVFVLGEKDLPL